MKKWIQGVAVGLLLSSLLLFLFAADNKPVNETQIINDAKKEQQEEIATLQEENNSLRLELSEEKAKKLNVAPPATEPTPNENKKAEATPSKEPISITFSKGEKTTDLAAKLVKQKLIPSQATFLSLLEETGKAEQIRTGTYVVTSDMSVEEIAFVFIRRPSSY